MTGRWAASVLALVLLWTTSILARDKTDVVTLNNGDHITGEISEVSRGRLELKTNDAGTIDIEFQKIVSVESPFQYEVITSDGRHLLGSLGHTNVDRFIMVVGIEESVALSIDEVANVTPIGKSFWAKLDGSFDAGFNYTKSSGIAQTTINSNTLFRRPAFQFQMTASATLTHKSDDDNRDDRGSFAVNFSRYRRGRLYAAAGGRLETNESLGLLLRSQLGGGVGLRVVNTNRAQLGLGTGLVVNNEQGIDTEATQNLEALFNFLFSYYTYDKPKTNIDASVQYYPSLSSWGRQRLQVDASIKREVMRDFFVSTNVFETLDTAPPNPEFAQNDFGVVLSVGWSY